jgi:D-alanyl-D-alanine carboxypeptidase (penicillin-binding protein 5/6)
MNAAQRIRTVFVALLVAVSLSLPAPLAARAAAFAPPRVKVPSSILMTMDGTVLWSRHPASHRRVASTIKLLNALVLRDSGTSLDATVTVPRKACIWDGGVGLVRGQVLTIRQLLRMMLIASANDAAEVIAIRVGGSEKAYVAMMNAKAAALGLKNTHAIDPHGLSKRETSTAADLTVLARHAMADPVLRKTVRKKTVLVPRPGHKARRVKSTDLLLGCYDGIEGVKTGFTNPAGYCFIGAAKRGEVELLGVVLGAKSNPGRFSEMRHLLDWGFKHTHSQTLVSTDTTMGTLPVAGFPGLWATVHPAETVIRALLDGGPFQTIVTLPANVTWPVVPGLQVGTVEVSRGGVTFATVPLLVDASLQTTASADVPADAD